jgi:hypothetical protein
MFLKVSSLVFVILLGATTKCWSVAEELANIHLQTGRIYHLKDNNFTVQISIGGGEYSDHFDGRSSLRWENHPR